MYSSVHFCSADNDLNRASNPRRKTGNAGKLENELFSEFGWKTWKTIGFSPALVGKAGILALGLMIISAIIR